MRPELGALALFSGVLASAAHGEPDPRVAAAVAERDAGRTGEAIAALQRLAAERPGDTNVLRLLASSYAAERRFAEAGEVLDRARALAPQDRDIMLAEARLALWRGQPAEAARIADAIARLEPANPELPALRRAIAAARPKRSAGLSFTQNVSDVALASGHRTWEESVAALDLPVGSRERLTLEVDRADRGFAVDTSLDARLDRSLDGASLYLASTATPHADFRERWSIRGGGDIRLLRNLWFTLDGRYAKYRSTGIEALEPGLRLELPAATLAVRSINLWDELGKHRFGWSARADVYPSDRFSLFAGAATYPDTEEGVTRTVNAIFGGVALPIRDGLDLRLTAEHEVRKQSYRRTGLSLGLHWRFRQ